ncbi:NnrS family protein [Neisseria sp. S1]|uniref:NnrS family protein n=1 Tax=Neisseria sp. S1 TaxID=3318354 RepID=UPI003A83D631
MTTLFKQPIWAMAFRPLYVAASLFGIVSILLWGFGYSGTTEMPSFYWHAHEMIWGYTGAIVVGFLLTAVATWTQQPPVRGLSLVILVCLWLFARLFALLPGYATFSGITGTLFFWLAAAYMALPVIRSHNNRNYITVFTLFLFGFSHAAFHWHIYQFQTASILKALTAGLIIIAGFIGLIGMRVIPFFTAKRLNISAQPTPTWVTFSVLALPIIMSILILTGKFSAILGILGLLTGLINLIQTFRWWHKKVWHEPMLLVLFAGYLFAALGLIVIATAQWLPAYLSLGIHLIGVGGIGLLTIGMMARTALGHTGRAIYPAPTLARYSFVAMLLATLVRILAIFFTNKTAYFHSIRISACLFALALLLYAWQYIPWLISPRGDNKPG